MRPVTPPDWYLAIRAARYGGIPVTEALGLPWGPTIETWCLTAEAAEQEAEAAAIKNAQKQANAQMQANAG